MVNCALLSCVLEFFRLLVLIICSSILMDWGVGRWKQSILSGKSKLNHLKIDYNDKDNKGGYIVFKIME